jgi:hypothetical protein
MGAYQTNEDNSQMVTLASNYQLFLQQQTIDQIECLKEEGFNLEQMLNFIDTYSENDFVLHFEDYTDSLKAMGNDSIGQGIVDCFISFNGIGEVASVQDAFVGWYSSNADFAEEYMNEIEKIPTNIVVDWDATWDSHLQYDFDSADIYRCTGKGYGVNIFRRYY